MGRALCFIIVRPGRIFCVIANTATADTTIENIIFFNNTMSGAGGILATAVTASQNNTYIKTCRLSTIIWGSDRWSVGTSLQTYPGSFGNVIVDGISISGSNHMGGSTNQSLLLIKPIAMEIFSILHHHKWWDFYNKKHRY